MDIVGLEVLVRELRADAAIFDSASETAKERLSLPSFTGQLEATGFELSRCYNILEKMFERITTAFENNFDKRGDYHDRLIERVSLDFPGLRPAFLPPAERERVRDLKGFRHKFRHAYELQLKQERMNELVDMTCGLSRQLPGWIDTFESEVKLLLKG